MIESLSARFTHHEVDFRLQDKLVMIDMKNRFGSVTLTTHGATVLSYKPNGGEDVFWVSETACYDGSKPVRGGVPVCWPWFGPYNPEFLGADATDAAKKGHGVARYEFWQVESVGSVGDATQVVMLLQPNDSIKKAWPHDFALRLVVTLAETLRLELVGENLSDRDWLVSEAFHTYFRVANAGGMPIHGLEGVEYVDKLKGGARSTQQGLVLATTPMEAVYVHQDAELVMDDQGNNRKIVVRKQNAASVVAWNPGPEGAKSFADMPDADYARMMCVETGNALDDAYVLKAGEKHVMLCEISVR